MLRRDGIWEIYLIEHYQAGFMRSPGRWVQSSFDHFGSPIGFSCGAECWQSTGVRGTFDRKIAIEGLKWIQKQHPVYKFRLVRTNITQTTVVLIEKEEENGHMTLEKAKELYPYCKAFYDGGTVPGDSPLRIEAIKKFGGSYVSQLTFMCSEVFKVLAVAYMLIEEGEK